MTPRQILSAVLSAAWLLSAPATADDVIEYFGLDALGNIRLITDENGNIVERHDYYPFGEECTTGPCASNPGVGAGQARKFTGKERDTETGLDYFGARYYGSKIGRFTTVDPMYTWNDNLLDPQRWNRYAYGRNNPLRYADPDGRAIDIVVDVGSITYDLADIYAAYKTGNSPTTTEWLALGGDVVGAAVPFVTGVGAAIRAGSKVEHGIEAGRATSNIVEGGKATNQTREGMVFTKAGKRQIDTANAEKYGGKNVCENCKGDVVPGKLHEKGVRPPDNERHRDHVEPRSKGGRGIPDNGQVLCRTCNIEKSDN